MGSGKSKKRTESGRGREAVKEKGGEGGGATP